MPGDFGGYTPGLLHRPHPALFRTGTHERFVANFFRLHLKDWKVSAQKRLEWHTTDASERLPLIIPEITCRTTSPGVCLSSNTKLTAQSLTKNRWGKVVFQRLPLDQLYAYQVAGHVPRRRTAPRLAFCFTLLYGRFSERVTLQDQQDLEDRVHRSHRLLAGN